MSFDFQITFKLAASDKWTIQAEYFINIEKTNLRSIFWIHNIKIVKKLLRKDDIVSFPVQTLGEEENSETIGNTKQK